jgi:excisionase family DNA binding protein
MGVSLAGRPAAGVLMDATRPYLTIRETAALLALSTRTIHRYIAEGKLKAYRVAGEKVIRIKREDVDALLEPVGDEGEIRTGRRGRGVSPTSTETS